ncbi:ankyrin repeat protein [Ophiostoma piceae UAMH 11346]|uniref:Ankyrin repeat protein n=1 Tax=Ophiostoma piceae (strain UAMH 11346) TaxID=1262450 RepID=S3CZK7_OPHP1|nr:ankyrin repeat protein [Ophiostoma piceae UAMH 11346]
MQRLADDEQFWVRDESCCGWLLDRQCAQFPDAQADGRLIQSAFYLSYILDDHVRNCQPRALYEVQVFRPQLIGLELDESLSAPVASSTSGSNDIQQEHSRDNLASLANNQESPTTPSLSAPAESSTSGSNGIQEERSESDLGSLANIQESPATQSLWNRAYDALAKQNPDLVKEYEKLLAKEEQMANSASNDEPPAQPIPPRDATCGPDSLSRETQLETVIKQGLQRMEEAKATYTIAGHDFDLTDQITQAANLLLWAKDWIGAAVHASPEASIAWTGVCLILPLLTNPTTAAEANRDGFAYVTARMRYYVALEPLLRRLGENAGVADMLMSEANDHIVDLYQLILDFQLCSVLRFYQGHRKIYLHDMFSTKDWKQTTLDIKTREEIVNQDLRQINELVAREELERLNNTSTNTLTAMESLLSVSTQQLAVLQEQLVIQKDTVQQKLFGTQKKCLQLFCATKNEKDVTYDWYKDRVKVRVKGTCQWLVQHDHFKRWLAQESGPLLVSADPGCGKSVLAKYLIDEGLTQQSATICYFFFKDQDQNTARQALCALLHQLFSQKGLLIQHAMQLYNKMGPALIKSEGSLWTILGNAVRDPQAGPVIIVLDALDECAESELKDLIQNMERLLCSNQPANAKLRFLLTSRPYEQILDEFWGLLNAFPHIHIPGEEESETISQEINRVIQHRVEQLARKQRLSDKIKSSLEEKLLGIEHRTYLWVYLVFDYLDTGFTKTTTGVEAAIQTLPKSVNQAYERILNRSRDDPMVKKVLSVVLAARRPLTVSEMNIAVTINGEVRSISDLELEEEAEFKSRLRTWCGLFVSFHHGRVYFLHQTAREFLSESPSSPALSSELRWHHSITTRHAHTVLAEICVFYLNMFNSEEKGASRHNHEDGAFLDYSANNWGIHFHETNFENNSAMVSLATGLCDPDSASHLMWSTIYCPRNNFIPSVFTGLLVPSHFGLYHVAQLLLDKGADVEAKDNNSRTPLSYAASQGYEALARLLLDKGADIDAKDDNGQTPLSYAASQGYEALARLLLDKGADIDAKDDYGQTPLLYALKGHEAVARVLLDKGADIEAKDNNGWTPLIYAASRRYEAVARLLLDKGADVDAKDNNSRTPLFYAASKGHEAVARLLLDKGADVDAKDSNGQTPLLNAVLRRHEAVARLLLDKGADVEAKNNYNQTPLSYAASQGYEALARLLLDKGADIDAKDNNGQTPLLYTALKGHEAVARVLLDKGADIEAKDNDGWTPLIYAASGRHEAVARLLLDKGADVDAKDNNNRTPLFYTTSKRHEAVARVLLDKGADIEAKDNDGWTPLIYAASRRYEAVARLLLDKGADIEAKDKDGWTPLIYAASGRHEAVARLLLDKGADVDAKDNNSRTPLFYAASKGHEAVARLLLDKSADVDTKDSNGQTPLLNTVLRRHEAVARLLLDKGADVEAKNNYDQTPLLNASIRGHEAVARVLLDKGADVEAEDNDGQTSLLYAASQGYEGLARLLLDKGADIDAKDNAGRTPLFYAASKGHKAVARLLLDNGADIDAKDNAGRTPLFYAVLQRHEAVVQLLVDKGADVEAEDSDDQI